jgi:hypothetical protein
MSAEGLTGRRLVQHERRDEAGATQAGDEGGGGAPMAMRRGIRQVERFLRASPRMMRRTTRSRSDEPSDRTRGRMLIAGEHTAHPFGPAQQRPVAAVMTDQLNA